MVRSLSGARVPEVGPLRVTVWGSAVSRAVVSAGGALCLDYVARQSWISATSAGLDHGVIGSFGLADGVSVVGRDLASDALESVLKCAWETDVLLLDIVDDRFGVRSCADGFMTPSPEFFQSEARHGLQYGELIPFGSDEHFSLFADSARAVSEVLKPVLRKVVVLGVEFTGVAVDGSEVASTAGRSAGEWNDAYARYYSTMVELGFEVVWLPAGLAVTTPHHKWGCAPFHFIEQASMWWYEQVCVAVWRSRRGVSSA